MLARRVRVVLLTLVAVSMALLPRAMLPAAAVQPQPEAPPSSDWSAPYAEIGRVESPPPMAGAGTQGALPTVTSDRISVPAPLNLSATAPAVVAPPQPPADAASGERTARVPILMYHYTSAASDPTDRIRVGLSVTPEVLESHLRYLTDNHYTTISLYDLHRHLTTGAPLPPNPIILTFDDGYIDNYANAYPLLRKYGKSATFFVITDFVGNNPAYMNWDMIKELSASGMSIESHTRTHPDMRFRKDDYLVWQILGPIEAITAHTGRQPRFFAYPSGQFDANTIRVLESAGTWGAVTTMPGDTHRASDALTWSRVRVGANMAVSDLSRALGR